MFYTTLVGCTVFLITTASLLYASHLIVRRFSPDSPPPVRIISALLLFYSFIIVVFQLLSPFHAISRNWVTVTCLVLATAAHLIWGNLRDVNTDLDPVIRWIRDGLSSRWATLMVICGFVVLLSFSRALLMPPLGWDSLKYHLVFAALWIKKGTILLFTAPDQIIDYAHLPINGELFASFLLLPFHSDLLVNTMNFPIIFLGGIACYAVARELGLPRREAGFAPALICFSPMLYPYITTQYVDGAVFAFFMVSVLFTLRYLRGGYLNDGILAVAGTGLLLGTKYTGITGALLVSSAVAAKTVFNTGCPGFFRKAGMLFLGISILCLLGGRQYILNTVEARNPLYPFPVVFLGHEIFEGSLNLDPINEFVSRKEEKTGVNRLCWREREYRKFCYLTRTAGPKFLGFLLLALFSVFVRPREVSRKAWHFITMVWCIPIVVYYADSSASFAKKAYWMDESTRFLAPFIALFAIQGLVLIKRFRRHFKGINFLFAALVAWDLLYVKKDHLWEIEVLYPLIILLISLSIFFIAPGREIHQPLPRTSCPGGVSRLGSFVPRRKVYYVVIFLLLVAGLYTLTIYRDTSRYRYYQRYTDLNAFPRSGVDGWEFLDQPDTPKTIAMTMNWEPPGGKWLLYPLLGKQLQNDVVYVSAKYNWDVPTWLHQGLLRGDDYSIWLANLKKQKVDYIFVQKPMPVELTWMLERQDKFPLMFSNADCQIFKYREEEP